MKVTGLGQSSLDLLVSVEDYPIEDTKPEALDLTTQGGGPVATALVALARLKIKTEFIGCVSDDPEGKLIKKELKDEGVGTKGLITRKGGASQKAFIIVNQKNGSRTILWKRPTIGEVKPGEVTPSLIKGADLLLIDGLMARASLRAVLIARKLGVPIMLDAGRMREGMLDLIKQSDYIVGSENFSVDIAGKPAKAINKLIKLNPDVKAVTITLGNRGSITHSGSGTFRQSAFPVRAVDTTGAGDVFHGGYCYGILQEWPIERTVRFASAFAALKCLKPGGRTGIPTLNQTLRFMEEGG